MSLRQVTLTFSCLLYLLGGAVRAVHGQSALDGFDPNANDYIRVAVVQPDGKILIGGYFTTVAPNGGAPVARGRIARLNADGTLDTAFAPNANGPVLAIALQPDGKILVGGTFTSVGGQARNYIARLDPVTGAPDSFDPSANQIVSAIALQADGKVLVGGHFSGPNSIGGQARNFLARLDGTTGLADSFDPHASADIYAILVQPDGRIVAGGDFTTIGGQLRNRVARLNAVTGLADGFNPNVDNSVNCFATQADGMILVGGGFYSVSGQVHKGIARLDPITGLADSFNPNSSGLILSMAVQSDGKIVTGGFFTSIGGQMRGSIARLDPNTGQADSFDAGANFGVLVYAIAVQSDGKVLAGGTFTSIRGQSRNRIARLERDGRLDQTLNANIVGNYIQAVAMQPNGCVVIGGKFTSVLGTPRNNIARLNTDGTLDLAFDPNANNVVSALVVQPDGQILVAGQFTNIGGAGRSFIARLDATTGAADSFNPSATQRVTSIATQTDGKILAGGFFYAIGGEVRNFLARLDAVTGAADSIDFRVDDEVETISVQANGEILLGGFFESIDGQARSSIARMDTTGVVDDFDPDARNGEVLSIAVQANGKILAGGGFYGRDSIGGATRNFIARLDPATGLADSFDPNANRSVYTIAVQSDGKIFAGGEFYGANGIGGQTRTCIARLDATTGAADSFDPGLNEGDYIYGLTMSTDGKVLAGGFFNQVGGQPRNGLVRLTNDTAALENLAVCADNTTWTRGGSNILFTRVTFEFSTDNMSYTPLGAGTASDANWTLNGLSLPTGQNIYIRARGYYRGGYQNDSESIAEVVRNAFIPPTLKVLSVVRAANGHLVLRCLGIPNRINDLQFSTDLSPGSFTTVVPAPAPADATGVFQYDDAGAVGATKRFYRLGFP